MTDARRPRILVIDDDANVREVVLHLLASFGYDVDASADPVSGLARFKEGGWDLVLVDVVMVLAPPNVRESGMVNNQPALCG